MSGESMGVGMTYSPDFLAQRVGLRDKIINCTACSLHSTCKRPVPPRGPSPTRIAIVGEAPGRDEDEYGTPFIGASGRMMSKIFAHNDLDFDECFITNTIQCLPARRPPTPELAEIEACRPNLIAALQVAQPTYVIVLGQIATTAMLRQPLRDVRRRFHKFFIPPPRFVRKYKGEHPPDQIAGPFEMQVWATFHPGAAMRNKKMGALLLEDIALFAKEYRKREALVEP